MMIGQGKKEEKEETTTKGNKDIDKSYMQNHMKEQDRMYGAFWFKNSLTWCNIAFHNFDPF